MTTTAVDWELVAGLETHVQLGTESKLFCACATGFGAPPNTRTCPVCLGHPGVLPVLNRRALELGVKAGLALQCRIAPRSKFDRKNYYYPDLPKNYQVSQFDVPLARDGGIDLPSGRRIRIHRAHLEEDAGKLIHEEGGARSFVDLNRAGTPLLEIVTEPDLRSAEEAYQYLVQLKAILRHAGISDCDMEKGQLRVDVNVSLRPRGTEAFGVKIEIKNVNSFRFVQKAIEHEVKRQAAELAAGRKLVQSTRLYDSDKDETRLMRTKEGAADYRYFPEPDLPPFEVTPAEIERIRATLPELPAAKRERMIQQYGLGPKEAAFLADDPTWADFYEAAVKGGLAPKSAANWIVNEVARVLNDRKKLLGDSKLGPGRLIALVRLVDAGTITAASGKDLLGDLVESDRDPAELVRERGLAVVNDLGEISKVVEAVVAENPKAVADFKGGKDASVKFLVGQVMKRTQGRVKAPVAEELLRKALA